MEKTDEAAKARHRSEYQRAYRAGYKKRMKRVTLTMTLEEY